MRPATRLDKLAKALGRDDDGPRLLVLVEDDDGRLWLHGQAYDPATLHPGTHVVLITQRPDGPQ